MAEPAEMTLSPSVGWGEIVRYRELLLTLALREIQVRYKQAVLGVAWVILQPLSLMLVFTLFFSVLLRIPSDGIPYPLFAYVALVPWGFFAAALSSSVTSLTSNANLVTRVYFPRAVLPLATVVAAAADFAVAALGFVGLLLFYRVTMTGNLLFVPLIFLIQLTLILGLALGLSALNVAYRDVRHALPLLVQLWFFVTPVIYPVSVVPDRYRTFYLANPMAGIIDSYRKTIIQGTPPDVTALALATCAATGAAIAAWWYFRRAERTFADVI
jgi:lipopolysaccharide transport system permease protein